MRKTGLPAKTCSMCGKGTSNTMLLYALLNFRFNRYDAVSKTYAIKCYPQISCTGRTYPFIYDDLTLRFLIYMLHKRVEYVSAI